MNISFNAQHAPMGAFMSFTLGRFGAGGGIGVQIGKPANQNIYVGVKDGDRFSESPLTCLPFYRDRPTQTSAADFMVEQAGPSEQNVAPHVTPFQREQIRRDYSWATDRWTAGELQFAIYTPFGEIPEPGSAPGETMRGALLPAIIAELHIDNSGGKETRTALFAIHFDTPGLHQIATGIAGAGAFALHDSIGLAAQVDGAGELVAIQRWDVAEALRDINPVHQLGTTAGFAVEVPAGQKRTLRIALGCYLRDGVTTGMQGRYLYTRYFESLSDVLGEALRQFDSRKQTSRQLDRRLLASGLSADQQFHIAHATRGYYGSTQLLQVDGEPFWIVNEGEYCMMNTLDLSIDHAFWELEHNPWVVRDQLDHFAQHYSYADDRGISFAHDMGVHNNFSPPGTSSYELAHLKGCFSFMTQEQLCNWILLAACYVAATNDLGWLGKNQSLLDQCARSLRARADAQTGIMAHDSDRCQGGWEITTYDSLDASLGQARANTYLATKCWASWIALEMLAQIAADDAVVATPASPSRQSRSNINAGVARTKQSHIDSLAGQIERTLIAAADMHGVIPAVLEKDSPGYHSRILPIIEALVYPAFWLRCGQTQDCVTRALEGRFITALRQHTLALLDDPQRRNVFADGGIKLSSTSDNSWMSKIALFQFVARQILHIPTDARADAAHLRWQTDGSSYWACSDQFVNGVAKGSRYYPRLITAALWLSEKQSPAIDLTLHKQPAAIPQDAAS